MGTNVSERRIEELRQCRFHKWLLEQLEALHPSLLPPSSPELKLTVVPGLLSGRCTLSLLAVLARGLLEA